MLTYSNLWFDLIIKTVCFCVPINSAVDGLSVGSDLAPSVGAALVRRGSRPVGGLRLSSVGPVGRVGSRPVGDLSVGSALVPSGISPRRWASALIGALARRVSVVLVSWEVGGSVISPRRQSVVGSHWWVSVGLGCPVGPLAWLSRCLASGTRWS